jgi:hypothetical protein
VAVVVDAPLALERRVPRQRPRAAVDPRVLLDAEGVEVEHVARAAVVERVQVQADLVVAVDVLARRHPGADRVVGAGDPRGDVEVALVLEEADLGHPDRRPALGGPVAQEVGDGGGRGPARLVEDAVDDHFTRGLDGDDGRRQAAGR